MVVLLAGVGFRLPAGGIDIHEVERSLVEQALARTAGNQTRAGELLGLNRDQIREQAHDRSWDPFDRSIDIRISRLRRKIEKNPQHPTIIRTVRGIGYIYDPE